MNVRLHINSAIGRRTLAKLSPLDVQAMLNAKLDEGPSPRAVQYVHATLCAALNAALRWGLLGRNVATPSIPSAGTEYPSPRSTRRR